MCDYNAFVTVDRKPEGPTEAESREKKQQTEAEQDARVLHMLDSAKLPAQRLACQFNKEWLAGMELHLMTVVCEKQPTK